MPVVAVGEHLMLVRRAQAGQAEVVEGRQ